MRSRQTLRLLTVLVMGLALMSCGSSDLEESSGTLAPGGDTAQMAVQGLVDALTAGDFDRAVPLAVANQAALATLAEGATFGQVADAIRNNDREVVANFWAGFAQGAGEFLTGSVQLEPGEGVRRDDIDYSVVRVVPASGGERELFARESEGYRIDLFASFAPGLASRMVGPVERLLSAQTDDARLVLSELRDAVPSLLVAAERPSQPPDVVQSVLRLVELITRVG